MSLANLTNNILTEVNTSGVVVANGTAAPTAVVGTADQILRRNSANTAYEFFTPSYILSGAAAGGELAGTYPNPTLLNSAVIGKVLTGLNVTGGNILATDSILTAFGKLQNQVTGLTGGVTYQGTWNASTNTPALASSVGTKGFYYVVSVAGTTSLNGVASWALGDWVIYNGTAWEKVDNTDAVVSVNGFTGAVSLTTANISEVTNLYFSEARVRATTLTGYALGTNTAITATDTVLGAFNKIQAQIDAKQNTLSLTTTANNGAATLVGATLNIPNYTLAGLGGFSSTGSFFIGTTSIAINRASAAQTLTGVSIDGNAATVTNGVYTTTFNTLGDARYLRLIGGTLTGQLDGTTAQFRGDGAGGDTISYSPLGVTRAVNPGNNMAYIAMTKAATLVWAMGIGSTNEFIVGNPTATTQVITTPHLSLNTSGVLSVTSGFTANKTSSDSVLAGPFISVRQPSDAKQWVLQLNTSNGLDFWVFNATSWALPISFSLSGNVTAVSFNGYTFNQNLNTTSNVTFNRITGTNGGQDSDLNLKNVVGTGSLLNIADQMAVIRYFWKDVSKGTTMKFGYGAQHIQLVIPEAVYKTELGTLAVDYTQVHTVLIDENTRRIQALEAEVKSLKEQLNIN